MGTVAKPVVVNLVCYQIYAKSVVLVEFVVFTLISMYDVCVSAHGVSELRDKLYCESYNNQPCSMSVNAAHQLPCNYKNKNKNRCNYAHPVCYN